MKPSMELLDTLSAIAEEAGAAIMEVYDGEFIAQRKADHSPLTIADLRADAIIRERLTAVFPGIFIWSEESCDRAPEDEANDQTFFLVDPLDGTKEFIKRNGEFTVNIALISSGVPVAGVVFAPALDVLYYASPELGAWRKTGGEVSPLVLVERDRTGPLRVIGSRSHGGEAMASWLAKLECPHTFVSAGSSLKFCRIAEGEADIYPRLGPTSQWDTAAAQCVLEAAGGIVVCSAGQPIRYGLLTPVLNPCFFAASGKDDCRSFVP